MTTENASTPSEKEKSLKAFLGGPISAIGLTRAAERVDCSALRRLYERFGSQR